MVRGWKERKWKGEKIIQENKVKGKEKRVEKR